MSQFDTVGDKFAQESNYPLIPAKYLFRHVKEVNVGMKCDNRLALTMNGVIPRDIDDVEGLQSADYSVYQIVERNDLLFKLIDLENIKTSRVGHVPERGIVSPAYIRAVAISHNIETRFYYWYYYAAYLNNVFNGMGAGVRQTLGASELLGALVPMPAKSEQVRIANFLDEKTARIDALIAEKERLVDSLQEYRQSIVTATITRGIPGEHREFVKHPFLGTIPAIWKAGKFKHYVYFRSGQVDPEDKRYSDMVLIAPNHIASGTGRLIQTETAAEQAAESGKYWCDAGDVIYSKIRPALRKATLAPFDCLCSADMYPLKGASSLTNSYLFWYLLSEPFSVFAEQESMRVAMPKLNRETMSNAFVPLPSLDEQTRIVRHVERECVNIDTIVEHVQENIDRLREYRSSLISAAVTGQFDMEKVKA